jgi:hypothetical protein
MISKKLFNCKISILLGQDLLPMAQNDKKLMEVKSIQLLFEVQPDTGEKIGKNAAEIDPL